jgi:hypothetical protein
LCDQSRTHHALSASRALTALPWLCVFLRACRRGGARAL